MHTCCPISYLGHLRSIFASAILRTGRVHGPVVPQINQGRNGPIFFLTPTRSRLTIPTCAGYRFDMRKSLSLFAFAPVAILALAVVVASAYAQISGLPAETTVRYAAACPTTGFFPGQICVELAANSDVLVKIWNSNDDAWEEILGDSASITPEDVTASDDVSVGDTLTVTGALTANGNVTLGNNEDDTVTVNAPVIFEVTREDFDAPTLIIFDLTNGDFVQTAADTETNLLLFPSIPIYYRNELGFAGTFTVSTFLNNQAFNIDDATILDVADNDAKDYVVGGPPTQAFLLDTDSTETAYCEISFTITTIANVSAADFYFGVMASAAVDDTFAIDAATSRAIFIINDTAGDLDIETELAAGGTLNDDTAYAWVDGATKVLRVEVSAADVDFYLDGVQVAQTNAILNPAAATMMVCRFGIRSAGTAKAGIAVNYIETGRAQ